IKGPWSEESTAYGYDYWYQPRHNVMISSQWGSPKAFCEGFLMEDVIGGAYGDMLTFWNWKERTIMQQIKMHGKGLLPLENRFLHDPDQAQGFTGAALSSNIIHFSKGEDARWKAAIVLDQPWLKVEGWILPEVPPLITDILLSLDDRFLYLVNWLRGDLAQYDIRDPAHPKFVSRLWLGGVAHPGTSVKVKEGMPEDTPTFPELPEVQGHKLLGGPQMLQLSLDGKRLYVTNSLFTAWDQQFYPDMCQHGSYMLQIDVDPVQGGMKLNHDFYIDCGAEPDGPVLAHEIRFPTGDSTSDIWC
ncbi:hypothetical protein WJX84_003148, partial [Apatococcus fuscideae]